MDSVFFLTEVQDLLVPLDGLLRWLSLHTYSTDYLLIAVTLYWSGYARTGARLGCSVLTSTLVFFCCRQLFTSSRPYWDHPQLFNGLYEKDCGMPSGHSQNAVTFWGLSAYSSPGRLFWLVALFFMLTIATSRLYLGLHYPDQVFTGLFIGVLMVSFWISFEESLLRKLLSIPLIYQIMVVLFLTGLPCMITLFLREVLGVSFGSVSPTPYKQVFFYTGLLSGAGVSLLLAFTRTTINQQQPSLKLVFSRTLPGLFILWQLWQFRYFQPEGIKQTHLLYLIFWLQAVLMSFWVCLLWPLLQQKYAQIPTGRYHNSH